MERPLDEDLLSGEDGISPGLEETVSNPQDNVSAPEGQLSESEPEDNTDYNQLMRVILGELTAKSQLKSLGHLQFSAILFFHWDIPEFPMFLN